MSADFTDARVRSQFSVRFKTLDSTYAELQEVLGDIYSVEDDLNVPDALKRNKSQNTVIHEMFYNIKAIYDQLEPIVIQDIPRPSVGPSTTSLVHDGDINSNIRLG